MTPNSVTIGDHTSINDRVMDIQITDFGDFIQNMEPDYANEYFYFDTRLRTYWRHCLQRNGKYKITHCRNNSKIVSPNKSCTME